MSARRQTVISKPPPPLNLNDNLVLEASPLFSTKILPSICDDKQVLFSGVLNLVEIKTTNSKEPKRKDGGGPCAVSTPVVVVVTELNVFLFDLTLASRKSISLEEIDKASLTPFSKVGFLILHMSFLSSHDFIFECHRRHNELCNALSTAFRNATAQKLPISTSTSVPVTTEARGSTRLILQFREIRDPEASAVFVTYSLAPLPAGAGSGLPTAPSTAAPHLPVVDISITTTSDRGALPWSSDGSRTEYEPKDFANLSKEPKIKKFLQEGGDRNILLSCVTRVFDPKYVLKTYVLAIADSNLYLFKTSFFVAYKLKIRIPLDKIRSIGISPLGDCVFILRTMVPDFGARIFDSDKKADIISALRYLRSSSFLKIDIAHRHELLSQLDDEVRLIHFVSDSSAPHTFLDHQNFGNCTVHVKRHVAPIVLQSATLVLPGRPEIPLPISDHAPSLGHSDGAYSMPINPIVVPHSLPYHIEFTVIANKDSPSMELVETIYTDPPVIHKMRPSPMTARKEPYIISQTSHQLPPLAQLRSSSTSLHDRTMTPPRGAAHHLSITPSQLASALANSPNMVAGTASGTPTTPTSRQSLSGMIVITKVAVQLFDEHNKCWADVEFFLEIEPDTDETSGAITETVVEPSNENLTEKTVVDQSTTATNLQEDEGDAQPTRPPSPPSTPPPESPKEDESEPQLNQTEDAEIEQQQISPEPEPQQQMATTEPTTDSHQEEEEKLENTASDAEVPCDGELVKPQPEDEIEEIEEEQPTMADS